MHKKELELSGKHMRT